MRIRTYYPCATAESPALKVKIKSLAAEAQIIRIEERKHRGSVRASLHNHRVYDVRNEQRASLLAHGFLRGKAMAVIENNPDKSHGSYRRALLRAERIAEKFSGQDVRIIRQRFAEWRG